MTSATGSISFTGLLGGAAGQIDITDLITKLMSAAAVPQSQLQDKVTAEQQQISAYQAINSKLSSLLTAGQNLTDSGTWAATSATSSNPSVVATSTAGAPLGTYTFDVKQLAQAQVSTIQADSSGNVLTTGTTSIQINGTTVNVTSTSASDVAAAINSAKLGVAANVVTADDPSGGTMQLLQLTATKTGAAGAFTIGQTGLANPSTDIVTGQDAQISVGGSGGYTVSSSTNTFTGVVPGVTFSASAVASNVSVTVSSGQKAISDAVNSLVTAANVVTNIVGQATGKGAVLASDAQVSEIAQSVISAVSRGTSSGLSLKTYGIDVDKNGVISFDADAFASAYAADPAGTKQAITDFATALNTTVNAATDPTAGTITTAISSGQAQVTDLNKEISTWDDRLAQIKNTYTVKFTAMETALAKLQSTQSYLTNMFNSMNNSGSSKS